MKKTLKTVAIIALLALLSAVHWGCKKDQIEEAAAPSLMGMWSHVRSTGASRHTVTQLHFKENQNGQEIIISIIGSQNSLVSSENFKWSTENDKVLKLQIAGETETYQYTIEADGLLKLTGTNGDTRDFYKD